MRNAYPPLRLMRQAGVTLIELAVTIALVGILAALMVQFIYPVFSYIDTSRRAALSDSADTALRRIGRDVRLALPNSTRVALAGGVYYLKRGDGKRAAPLLRSAVRLNPGAPTTLFKLAQAEKLAGNEAAAQAAMTRYQQIQDGRRAEADALDAISQHPEQPEPYVRAARLLDAHGQKPQADAILREAQRRFGPRLDSLLKSQPRRKSS